MIIKILILMTFTTLASGKPRRRTDRKLSDLFSNSLACLDFMTRFSTIKSALGNDIEAQSAIRQLELSFYMRFSERIKEMGGTMSGDIPNEQLIVSAFASLSADAVRTTASGAALGNDMVIAGAKGKVKLNGTTKTEIRGLALAESISASASASVISFATLRADATYNIDVKINDFYQDVRSNRAGQMVDSIVISKNFQFTKKQAAFGAARVFVVTLDRGVVRFAAQTLISGSARKTQYVLSKSIARVKTYTVSDAKGKVCAINDGVFLSENTCGFVGECVSNYYGWIRASSATQTSTQQGASVAVSSAASQLTQSAATLNVAKTYSQRRRRLEATW